MVRHSTKSQSFWKDFDWSLLGLVCLLCFLGLATLYSSTFHNHIYVFYKQIIFVLGGLAVALLISFLDYHLFERLAYIFYIFVLLLLMMVMMIGKSVDGSQRWLDLGPIHLQPSEFIKLTIIFIFARYYARDHRGASGGYRLRDLMPLFLLLGITLLLVFLQPDLGTTLLIAFMGGTIMIFCHLRTSSLLMIILGIVLSAPFTYHFVLKEYQRDRVRTFLNPRRDPLGEGYHAIQSMIAVGSGQYFGKGYKRGTQSKLEFLPKHHTDFIFSSFAEEWGFAGSGVLLGLYMIFGFLALDIARKAKDRFGSILAMGCFAVVAWHVIVNMGMEIGILPVVGVPLPFFSYGGSAMLTHMIAVGLLLSVSARRHIF